MKTITCPKCQKKSFSPKKLKCVNYECDLQHASNVIENEREPFSWTRLWWKIFYGLKPRRLRRTIQNIIWTRPDLVRTGLSKSSWSDVDMKMLYAVMNLVESYVVGEEGCELIDIPNYVKECEEELGHEVSESEINLLRKQNRYTQKIIDLYCDWKVTYPYMCQKLLDILMDDNVDSEAYFAFEAEVEKYEDSLMKRAINLRHFMWT